MTPRARIGGPLVLVFATLLAACPGTEPTPPGGGDNKATSIALAPATKSLSPGQTVQLTATVKNAAGATLTGQTLAYQSSATTVATVGADGIVTAVAAGTANITASIDAVTSAPAVITVAGGVAAAISKNADLPTGPVAGSNNTIAAKVIDDQGAPLAGVAVAFEVTAGGGTVTPASAITNAAGIASTTFKVGNTVGVNTATATLTGVSGSPVTFSTTSVAAAAASIVKLSTDPTTVTAGNPFGTEVRVKVVDAFGNAKSGTIVSFTVAAGGGTVAPATVVSSATGEAATTYTTGKTVGLNTMNASASGLTAVPFSITTVPGPLASIAAVTKVSIINAGATVTPVWVGKDANNNTVSSLPSLSFASRTTSVATVSAEGVVTGVAIGQSVVVATSTAGKDSILVVVADPTGPVLTTDMNTFAIGAGTTLNVTIVMDMRASGEKLGSTVVKLEWNPNVVFYQTNSTPTGGSPVTVNATGASTGSLSFSMANAAGLSGQVALLKVTFSAQAAGRIGTLKLTTTEVTGAGTFTNLLPKTVAVTLPINTR